jgi:sugar lactone lactonase YvrE
VWRIGLDATAAERVADGLALPPALKFSPAGMLTIISGLTGDVMEVDIGTGEVRRLTTVRPGLDNLAFSTDGRLFVSSFVEGGVTEVNLGGTHDGLVTGGFNGPYGLAATDGAVYVADGASLARLDARGAVERVGTLLEHGFPGVLRDVATAADGSLLVTTSAGMLSRYDPVTKTSEIVADGLQEPMGVAISATGTVAVAEAGAGRVMRIDAAGRITVLAERLGRPTGVAFDERERCYTADEEGGRVLRIDEDGVHPIATSPAPHGLAVIGGRVYFVDVSTKRLRSVTTEGDDDRTEATGLPVGSPPGAKHPVLAGGEMMPGPLTPFTGLAAGPDGRVYICGDGDGSVLVHRVRDGGAHA